MKHFLSHAAARIIRKHYREELGVKRLGGANKMQDAVTKKFHKILIARTDGNIWQGEAILTEVEVSQLLTRLVSLESEGKIHHHWYVYEPSSKYWMADLTAFLDK